MEFKMKYLLLLAFLVVLMAHVSSVPGGRDRIKRAPPAEEGDGDNDNNDDDDDDDKDEKTMEVKPVPASGPRNVQPSNVGNKTPPSVTKVGHNVRQHQSRGGNRVFNKTARRKQNWGRRGQVHRQQRRPNQTKPQRRHFRPFHRQGRTHGVTARGRGVGSVARKTGRQSGLNKPRQTFSSGNFNRRFRQRNRLNIAAGNPKARGTKRNIQNNYRQNVNRATTVHGQHQWNQSQRQYNWRKSTQVQRQQQQQQKNAFTNGSSRSSFGTGATGSFNQVAAQRASRPRTITSTKPSKLSDNNNWPGRVSAKTPRWQQHNRFMQNRQPVRVHNSNNQKDRSFQNAAKNSFRSMRRTPVNTPFPGNVPVVQEFFGVSIRKSTNIPRSSQGIAVVLAGNMPSSSVHSDLSTVVKASSPVYTAPSSSHIAPSSVQTASTTANMASPYVNTASLPGGTASSSHPHFQTSNTNSNNYLSGTPIADGKPHSAWGTSIRKANNEFPTVHASSSATQTQNQGSQTSANVNPSSVKSRSQKSKTSQPQNQIIRADSNIWTSPDSVNSNIKTWVTPVDMQGGIKNIQQSVGIQSNVVSNAEPQPSVHSSSTQAATVHQSPSLPTSSGMKPSWPSQPSPPTAPKTNAWKTEPSASSSSSVKPWPAAVQTQSVGTGAKALPTFSSSISFAPSSTFPSASTQPQAHIQTWTRVSSVAEKTPQQIMSIGSQNMQQASSMQPVWPSSSTKSSSSAVSSGNTNTRPSVSAHARSWPPPSSAPSSASFVGNKQLNWPAEPEKSQSQTKDIPIPSFAIMGLVNEAPERTVNTASVPDRLWESAVSTPNRADSVPQKISGNTLSSPLMQETIIKKVTKTRVAETPAEKGAIISGDSNTAISTDNSVTTGSEGQKSLSGVATITSSVTSSVSQTSKQNPPNPSTPKKGISKYQPRFSPPHDSSIVVKSSGVVTGIAVDSSLNTPTLMVREGAKRQDTTMVSKGVPGDPYAASVIIPPNQLQRKSKGPEYSGIFIGSQSSNEIARTINKPVVPSNVNKKPKVKSSSLDIFAIQPPVDGNNFRNQVEKRTSNHHVAKVSSFKRTSPPAIAKVIDPSALGKSTSNIAKVTNPSSFQGQHSQLVAKVTDISSHLGQRSSAVAKVIDTSAFHGKHSSGVAKVVNPSPHHGQRPTAVAKVTHPSSLSGQYRPAVAKVTSSSSQPTQRFTSVANILDPPSFLAQRSSSIARDINPSLSFLGQSPPDVHRGIDSSALLGQHSATVAKVTYPSYSIRKTSSTVAKVSDSSWLQGQLSSTVAKVTNPASSLVHHSSIAVTSTDQSSLVGQPSSPVTKVINPSLTFLGQRPPAVATIIDSSVFPGQHAADHSSLVGQPSAVLSTNIDMVQMPHNNGKSLVTGGVTRGNAVLVSVHEPRSADVQQNGVYTSLSAQMDTTANTLEKSTNSKHLSNTVYDIPPVPQQTKDVFQSLVVPASKVSYRATLNPVSFIHEVNREMAAAYPHEIYTPTVELQRVLSKNNEWSTIVPSVPDILAKMQRPEMSFGVDPGYTVSAIKRESIPKKPIVSGNKDSSSTTIAGAIKRTPIPTNIVVPGNADISPSTLTGAIKRERILKKPILYGNKDSLPTTISGAIKRTPIPTKLVVSGNADISPSTLTGAINREPIPKEPVVSGNKYSSSSAAAGLSALDAALGFSDHFLTNTRTKQVSKSSLPAANVEHSVQNGVVFKAMDGKERRQSESDPMRDVQSIYSKLGGSLPNINQAPFNVGLPGDQVYVSKPSTTNVQLSPTVVLLGSGRSDVIPQTFGSRFHDVPQVIRDTAIAKTVLSPRNSPKRTESSVDVLPLTTVATTTVPVTVAPPTTSRQITNSKTFMLERLFHYESPPITTPSSPVYAPSTLLQSDIFVVETPIKDFKNQGPPNNNKNLPTDSKTPIKPLTRISQTSGFLPKPHGQSLVSNPAKSTKKVITKGNRLQKVSEVDTQGWNVDYSVVNKLSGFGNLDLKAAVAHKAIDAVSSPYVSAHLSTTRSRSGGTQMKKTVRQLNEGARTSGEGVRGQQKQATSVNPVVPKESHNVVTDTIVADTSLGSLSRGRALPAKGLGDYISSWKSPETKVISSLSKPSVGTMITGDSSSMSLTGTIRNMHDVIITTPTPQTSAEQTGSGKINGPSILWMAGSGVHNNVENPSDKLRKFTGDTGNRQKVVEKISSTRPGMGVVVGVLNRPTQQVKDKRRVQKTKGKQWVKRRQLRKTMVKGHLKRQQLQKAKDKPWVKRQQLQKTKNKQWVKRQQLQTNKNKQWVKRRQLQQPKGKGHVKRRQLQNTKGKQWAKRQQLPKNKNKQWAKRQQLQTNKNKQLAKRPHLQQTKNKQWAKRPHLQQTKNKQWATRRHLQQTKNKQWVKRPHLQQTKNKQWAKRRHLQQTKNKQWVKRRHLQQTKNKQWVKRPHLQQTKNKQWAKRGHLQQTKNKQWVKRPHLQQTKNKQWAKRRQLQKTKNKQWAKRRQVKKPKEIQQVKHRKVPKPNGKQQVKHQRVLKTNDKQRVKRRNGNVKQKIAPKRIADKPINSLGPRRFVRPARPTAPIFARKQQFRRKRTMFRKGQ